MTCQSYKSWAWSLTGQRRLLGWDGSMSNHAEHEEKPLLSENQLLFPRDSIPAADLASRAVA